jgi:uncharacterized protein (DUF1499 family)
MLRWLRFFLIFLGAAALLLLGAGQLGLLAGTTPGDTLGVHAGRLAPPSATANSVSSQVDLYPDHPQHDHARIAPLQFDGDGMAAMTRLAEVLRARERTRIVVERPDYLRVELQSRWLRFVDDAEFWLDPSTGVIQVRSASRLGAGDLGTNRANIEDIRDRFTRP